MSDCLNAMTVGVQHKSAVIVGVVLGPQPGRTIVAPARGQTRRKSPPEFIENRSRRLCVALHGRQSLQCDACALVRPIKMAYKPRA